MKNRRLKLKVISGSCTPCKSPLMTGMLWYIFCDYYNAPGWVYGALGTFLGIWLIIFIYAQFVEETVNIFDEPDKLEE